MAEGIAAVILAGTLRPSVLRQRLDRPTLCLPLAPGQRLLDAWLSILAATPGVIDVRVVVNTEEDVELVRRSGPLAGAATGAIDPDRVVVIAEPAAWRGTGGLMRDVVTHLDDIDRVLLVEGSCVPPASIEPLVSAVQDDVRGVVGMTADEQPAGLMLFRREVVDHVPAVGYVDIKEQLLPVLYDAGAAVRAVVVGDRLTRLTDRATYLDAIARRTGSALVSPDAVIDPDARIDGPSVVEAGVVIKAGAVVRSSVVLAGAEIESDVVLSESIVGPDTVIRAGSRLVRDVLASPALMPDVATPGARRVAADDEMNRTTDEKVTEAT